MKSADGTGKAKQIDSLPNAPVWPLSISHDGNTLLFGQWSRAIDIGMLSMEGDPAPKLLLQEEYFESGSQISPDGRRLAYTSNESGQNEVYIRPFPNVDSSGRWQVSTDGGGDPLWAPDGKELFCTSSADEAMAVSVETDPIFRLGTPQSLFSLKPYSGWDIDPDGKRFLMMKEVTDDSATEEATQPKINIVLNWFEELKERIPID